MFSVVKIIISAIIIGTVTETARRSPAFGGAVAALPLVSILSAIWLYDQGEETERISRFVFGVLAGLPATAVLLLVAALALKVSLPLLAGHPFGDHRLGRFFMLAKFDLSLKSSFPRRS